MGPEPMSRIEEMSVRLGISAPPQGIDGPSSAPAPGHELLELDEEVGGVVGAGASFGMVLHREGGDVGGLNAFDDAVVQVDVGDLRPGHRTFGDGEVVVLAGDLDRAVKEAADRV